MVQVCASGEINILLYILVILFGSGSWIAINGLWVELPLFVQHLPEGWSLPSYLVIIVQIANIGPICYTLLHKYCSVSEKVTTYILIIIGAVACLLMAIFWSRTLKIGSQDHSAALFALAFCLSLVDCSSSVVFLPFMSKLKPQYLTAYFIGEGFSGLLPSLVALGQGAKGTECVNVTINGTSTIVPVPIPPSFGISVFCGFLCAMMIICGIAYILINWLPTCQSEYVRQQVQGITNHSNSVDETDKALNMTVENRLIASTSTSSSISLSEQVIPEAPSRTTIILILILVAWLNAMGNGFLPSFQSYATLPYGQLAFHLAVTLKSITTPVACFIMFVRPSKSLKLACVFICAGTAWMGLTTYLAAESPEPPLVGTTLGAVLVVSLTVLAAALFASTKVILATIMRDGAASALFWYGALTQVGSAGGATLAFLIVNTLKVFHSKSPCT